MQSWKSLSCDEACSDALAVLSSAVMPIHHLWTKTVIPGRSKAAAVLTDAAEKVHSLRWVAVVRLADLTVSDW